MKVVLRILVIYQLKELQYLILIIPTQTKQKNQTKPHQQTNKQQKNPKNSNHTKLTEQNTSKTNKQIYALELQDLMPLWSNALSQMEASTRCFAETCKKPRGK